MVGHPNAPLTPLGRRRLCERVDSGRPIAHVAAEAGISRRCLAKWYARWRDDGVDGLRDRSSTPQHQPLRTDANVEHLVEQMRRATKYGTSAHRGDTGQRAQRGPGTGDRAPNPGAPWHQSSA